MKTRTGRRQIIGAIDRNHPIVWAPQVVNKDSRRYLMNEDISGSIPKVYGLKQVEFFNKARDYSSKRREEQQDLLAHSSKQAEMNFEKSIRMKKVELQGNNIMDDFTKGALS